MTSPLARTIRHVMGIGGAALLVVGCMLLPFAPGSYDSFATGLSLMARVFAYAGLVVIPFAAAWVVAEWRSATIDAGTRPANGRFWLGVVTIAFALIPIALVSFAGFVSVGVSFGLLASAASVCGALHLARTLRARRARGVTIFNVTPAYFLIVPVAAAAGEFLLFGPVSDASRLRVIENSAPMIRDIERYRATNGEYPRSLQALWGDYDPGVLGVSRYQYEPNGDAYNLYFEHVAKAFGTREIVMYNTRGEHEMTSHDADLLQRTPAELSRMRGYYAVRDVGRPNWKLFWFD